MAAVERVGSSGWWILGEEVAQFEREFAERVGVACCVGFGNCLDATEMALRACGLEAGERVVTTPLTAFATVLAIVRAGGIPCFVDVDRHGLIDLALVEEQAQLRGDLRYLVPVHLYGYPLEAAALRRLAERGVTIVEDAAQAVGTSDAGRAAGATGRVGVTSFYPTKALGALGDGGAAFTDDEQIATRLRSLRDYGQVGKYEHHELGCNSRLDEFHAAILRTAILPRFDAWTERRREIAARYRKELDGAHVACVEPPGRGARSEHIFPVRVREGSRQALLDALRAQGVGAAVHYPSLCSEQVALEGVPHECLTPLDQAADLAAHEVSLPVHALLSDDEVSRIIESVHAFQP